MPWITVNGELPKETKFEDLGYVQVVRCKDCKHYKDGFCYNPNTFDDEKTKGNTVPDWFCADGEKQD